MANDELSVFESTGVAANVDTRTEAGGDHRQVVVIGDPSATDGVAVVQASDPASNAEGVVVRDIHTSAIAARLAGTIGIYVDSTKGTINVALKPGTIAVSLDPGYTLGAISGIGSSIQAHILSTAGTMAVNVGKTDGTVTIRTDPGYELGSIKGINSSIQAHILSTNGTMAVNIGKTDGTITIRTDPGYELGSIKGINSSIQVHLLSTGGTIHVRLADNSAGIITDDTGFTPATDSGFPMFAMLDDTSTDTVNEGDAGIVRMTNNRILMAHDDSTAEIFTVSGAATGVSVSGNTIISPSANAAFKIFAFSLTTTANTSTVAKFTNGAGTSPTEYWRVALCSTSGVTTGEALSVSPPSHLFATATSTTLSLVLDNGITTHYSVSYRKESA